MTLERLRPAILQLDVAKAKVGTSRPVWTTAVSALGECGVCLQTMHAVRGVEVGPVCNVPCLHRTGEVRFVTALTATECP